MDNSAALLDGFTNYIKHMSGNTIAAYRRDMDNFLHFIMRHCDGVDAEKLSDVTQQDIRAWLAHRITKQGISKRSNNRALSALRVMYKYLLDTYDIDNKALLSMRQAKTPRLLPKPVALEQINETLNALTIDSWIEKRDRALILLLYGCGLRISEALNLQMSQINNDTLFIKVIGKGNKERSVPVLSEVIETIIAYKEERPVTESPYLFIGQRGKKLSRHYFARHIKELSAGKIHAHQLRHSCASHLLNNGGSIKAIQQLLGHASLTSTQIYSNVSNAKLVGEYQKHHPRAKK